MYVSGCGPVSYTHLDVYKRQMASIPGMAPKCLGVLANSSNVCDAALKRRLNKMVRWPSTCLLYTSCWVICDDVF